MACRVRLDAFPEIRINETDLDVLNLIAERSGNGSRATPIAVAELARGTGKSVSSVRRACRVLREQGLITVRARHLGNGGNIENLYRLTRDGHAVAVEAEGRRPRRG